ncbi:MAG: thioredoxin-dependent thiol peroxidase [Bacteroidota bacterium]|nr:thioredoxin-dependent thiol peroxidase [Bacteroidota bacterium]
MTGLKIGDKAPEINAQNQDGKEISLNTFKGKKLILYFYPKDNTPGCTAEACNLRDNFQELKNKGFHILGVSPDSDNSHQKFIAKHSLNFDLISDVERKILKDYSAWGEKMMFGKVKLAVLRKTFVIDEEGKIEKIFNKVKTKEHAQQILNEYQV